MTRPRPSALASGVGFRKVKGVLPARFAAAIAALLASFATAPVHAQDTAKPPVPSIAIVDVEGVMRESLAVKSARNQLDEIAKGLQQEIASEEEKLRSAEQKLQQQRALLTPEKYAEERQAMQVRAAELQQRARQMRTSIDRGMAQTMQRIQIMLFDEVGKLAEELGVNIVLPRSQIVVAVDSFNITDEALNRLNARLKDVEINLERNEGKKSQ
jgi:outer membrane protein